MKKLCSILLILVMLLSTTPALAASSDIDAQDIVIDTLFLRPLGIISTAFGATFFVVSLPFAAITDSVGTSAQLLVVDPYEYTFVRPLGQIKSSD
jgi:hypothetical protein